jgi:hypothetical protein
MGMGFRGAPREKKWCRAPDNLLPARKNKALIHGEDNSSGRATGTRLKGSLPAD